MARSRDIRPEFFTDEKVGELSLGARLLFAALWCHSDLRGVFEFSPRQLRVLAFPFDEGLTSADVQAWIDEILAKCMIGRYEADGKTWGYITHWNKHQTISVREVEIGSVRPSPPGWIDPPSWAIIIEKAVKAGRLRRDDPRLPAGSTQNHSGTNPGSSQGHTQNTTPSPSPSPSPSPAPSPAPAPANSKAAAVSNPAELPPPPPPTRIAKAEETERLDAIHGAGGFLHFQGSDLCGEWLSATDGMTPSEITEALGRLRRPDGSRAQMPAGFAKALAKEREEHRSSGQRAVDDQSKERSNQRIAEDEARKAAAAKARIEALRQRAREAIAAAGDRTDLAALVKSVRSGIDRPIRLDRDVEALESATRRSAGWDQARPKIDHQNGPGDTSDEIGAEIAQELAGAMP
jgi:hypothetical protein